MHPLKSVERECTEEIDTARICSIPGGQEDHEVRRCGIKAVNGKVKIPFGLQLKESGVVLPGGLASQ